MQKDPFHKELAMRICAAYVSVQMGTTAATQYKHLKARETAGYDVGDAWYFLAQITVRVLAEAQDAGLLISLPIFVQSPMPFSDSHELSAASTCQCALISWTSCRQVGLKLYRPLWMRLLPKSRKTSGTQAGIASKRCTRAWRAADRDPRT